MESNTFMLITENDLERSMVRVRWVYYNNRGGMHCTQRLLSFRVLDSSRYHEEALEETIRNTFFQLLNYLDAQSIDYSTATI